MAAGWYRRSTPVSKHFLRHPRERLLEFLSALGVKGLVVHTERLRHHEILQWHQAQLDQLGLEIAAVFGPHVVYKILPHDPTHEVRFVLTAPYQLPRAATTTLGLLATGMDRHLWPYLGSRRKVDMHIEWVDQQTGEFLRKTQRLTSPFMLRGTEVLAGLPVDTPSSAGSFLLSIHVPLLNIRTTPQPVELTTDPFLTSLNAPQLLAAAYALNDSQSHSIIGEPTTVAVEVTNTGGAVWLAHTEDAKGAVRLGWDWLKDGQGIPSMAGRAFLPYDVFPGQQYTFNMQIATPMEPGTYTLALELVSEHVSWFSSQGIKRLEIPLQIVASLHSDLIR